MKAIAFTLNRLAFPLAAVARMIVDESPAHLACHAADLDAKRGVEKIESVELAFELSLTAEPSRSVTRPPQE